MAYDIAINQSSGDLALLDNDLVLIDNAERIAQQILITLRFWAGEWFLNTSDGMPYLEYVLVKNPNLDHIRQIITEAIESVPGVQEVYDVDLSINAAQRELYVKYEVTTAAGLLTQREVLNYG